MQPPSLNVFCDGGARGNPGPAASAFVVQDYSGSVLHEDGSFLGTTTNNQAEYQAVINALSWLTHNSSTISDRPQINFYLDSLLVVNQIKGSYRVKDQSLILKFNQVTRLSQALLSTGHLKGISYTYIPRSQNSRADLLVNQTLDNTLHSS